MPLLCIKLQLCVTYCQRAKRLCKRDIINGVIGSMTKELVFYATLLQALIYTILQHN